MPTSVDSHDAAGYLGQAGGKYAAAAADQEIDEDGFFTCAVSVQHKKHDTEVTIQSHEEDQGRKVVWPAEQNRVIKKAIDSNKCYQKVIKTDGSGQVDHPHYWLNRQEDENGQAAQPARVSRSRSRSKIIMERARSFERAAAANEAEHQQQHTSRPVSRSGSFRNRSSSAAKNDMDNNWNQLMDRPGSRTDVDSRRFMEVGRVNKQCWESRIQGSTENIVARTPPPPRKEMHMMKQCRDEGEEVVTAGTPEPPPPPARMHQVPRQEQIFPPPPCSAGSKLSEESVGMLSQDNREKSVLEWVNSTTQSREEIHKELEKFAYDIAESVVSTMEKNSDKSSSRQDLSGAVGAVGAGASAATNQMAAPERSSGVFHAVPAKTSQQLHGPIYVQEQTHRGQMTFQQEDRRRQEIRIKEEKTQEGRKRAESQEQERIRLEEEAQRREEENGRIIEEQRRQEEIKRAKEDAKRLEEQKRFEEQRRLEEVQRKKEEQRKVEEMRRLEEDRRKQEEIKIRQDEERRKEVQRRHEEEKRMESMKREQERQMYEEQMRKKEEERKLALEQLAQEKRNKEELERKKREEQERYEILKREEEACRKEEMRLEQELRKQYEIQQQKIANEEAIKKQKSTQEEINVREHIPKINKFRGFDNSQDRLNEAGKEREHLGKVKTGQVNDKRNFWIRSTSADRSGNQGLSPAPRRKRINTWSKQKDAEESDSRPGSSMGQALNGSVKNISNGFLSKSRSTAAVMQDEERARPPSRTRQEVAWTKEKYDENTHNSNFLKCQDVKTNKVNETITGWGKHDENTVDRGTPVPSRHIGQVFSDNKVARAENEKQANSWRTKTPEPSVKLVNVHVEKSLGSTQNIHISDRANVQMAGFVQETRATTAHQEFASSTTSSFSSSQSCTQTTSAMSQQQISSSQQTSSSYQASSSQQAFSSQQTSAVIQPPQAPERNQSIGGKSAACNIESETPCQLNKTKHKLEPVLFERTDPQPNQVFSVPNSNTNVSKQDKKQFITHSASAQSINSTLSTCSSGKIPLPIKNLWFDDDQMTSAASSYTNIPGSLLSPTLRTPIPVSAQWFTHSDLEKSVSENTRQQSLPVRSVSSEKMYSDQAGSMDDIDTKSVKSDTTVIENMERTTTPAPIIPPRPVELKRPYSPPPVPNHNELKSENTNSHMRLKSHKPDLIPSHSEYNTAKANNSRLSTYENVSCNVEPKHETKTFLTEHTDMLSIQSATNSFCSTATDRESIQTDITVTEKSPRVSNDDIISKFSELGDQTLAQIDKLISCENEFFGQSQDFDDKNISKESANVNALNTEAEKTSEVKDASCIISVPQSPKEIRKKFQENSYTQKKFEKRADSELSHEFRQGVRGKVRESKQSFFASSNSDKFLEAKEQREMELQQIRLQRSESKNRCDDLADESIESRGDQMRQEKLRELQDVQKSRFNSKNAEETISSTSYQELKRQREQELATLANRKIELEDAAFYSPTEQKEHQLREEREQELAALCARSNNLEPEYSDQQQEYMIEQQRESGYSECNQGIVEAPESPKPSAARRGSGMTLPAATIQDLTRELDALTDEAFDALDSSKQKSCEPEIKPNSVRDAKNAWLNREARGSSDRSKSNTPTPSRRIGSMFRKDTEYWNLEDDLPAPPPSHEQPTPKAHHQQIPLQQEDHLPPPPQQEPYSNLPEQHPPPPPRQSSRGKVDAYRSWSGTWKSGQ